MSNSSSDSAAVEAAAAPPAAQSMAPEDFAKRAPADAERTYQRRSSWELADDYHNKLWLRQAGGADRSLAQLHPPYAICRDHQALQLTDNTAFAGARHPRLHTSIQIIQGRARFASFDMLATCISAATFAECGTLCWCQHRVYVPQATSS